MSRLELAPVDREANPLRVRLSDLINRLSPGARVVGVKKMHVDEADDALERKRAGQLDRVPPADAEPTLRAVSEPTCGGAHPRRPHAGFLAAFDVLVRRWYALCCHHHRDDQQGYEAEKNGPSGHRVRHRRNLCLRNKGSQID